VDWKKGKTKSVVLAYNSFGVCVDRRVWDGPSNAAAMIRTFALLHILPNFAKRRTKRRTTKTPSVCKTPTNAR
jgi:hypothetical protein